MKSFFKTNRIWIIIFLFQFLFFYGVSRSAYLTSLFIQFFEWKKYLHQYIFSQFSFSIGDIFYVLTILFIFILFLLIWNKKRRKKVSSILLIIFNVFYLVYQLFWGTIYFQLPIIDKLSNQKPDLEFTKKIFLKYVALCNEVREEVSEDEDGVFRIENIQSLEKSIISQQQYLTYPFNQKKTVSIISIKPSLFGKVMNTTGILGYYNPFTAEAQYNPYMPSSMIPFTLAHETAHQLGYAREYEASFIGFLLAENTNNKDLKYGTYLYVVKSLSHYIYTMDSTFINQKEFLSEKVKRDLEFEYNYRQKHGGLTKRFFLISNDLFLKSNQQAGRVSYSYFVELFLRYENKRTAL